MVVSEPGRKLGYLNSKLMLRWEGPFNGGSRERETEGGDIEKSEEGAK